MEEHQEPKMNFRPDPGMRKWIKGNTLGNMSIAIKAAIWHLMRQDNAHVIIREYYDLKSGSGGDVDQEAIKEGERKAEKVRKVAKKSRRKKTGS